MSAKLKRPKACDLCGDDSGSLQLHRYDMIASGARNQGAAYLCHPCFAELTDA